MNQSRRGLPGSKLLSFASPKRKYPKKRRPRFAAASRFPALLDWSGGCGTRAARSDRPRRNPPTSLRHSAAHRGGKTETQNRKAGFVGCNKHSALHRMKHIRRNARWLLRPTHAIYFCVVASKKRGVVKKLSSIYP